jgi:hypothetical protein
MAGGHDSHGGHAAAAEPIIPAGSGVDRFLLVICVIATIFLCVWGMQMLIPMKEQKAHQQSGEGARPGSHTGLPATLDGTQHGESGGMSGSTTHEGAAPKGEGEASDHAPTSSGEGDAMTGPPAHAPAAGDAMSGPPAHSPEGDAMTGPPATEHAPSH